MFSEIVSNNLMLCPLAGYTDSAFRKLCGEFGAGLTVTEMISCKALLYDNRVTYDLLHRLDGGVAAAQLFGHEPIDFVNCVKSGKLDGYQIIDINMGCPVGKIIKNSDGSALMRDIDLASQIISETAKATNKPITVKFRLGTDERNINCVEFAKMCEDSGASAITLHARTARQMYSGQADMKYVEQVVKAVKIAVYANGDIASKEDCDRVMSQTGCFGVAIGRGALGKPWLFAELLGQKVEVDLYDIIERHYKMLSSYLQERIVAQEMKKHLAYYLTGLRGSKAVIVNVNTMRDSRAQLTLVKDFLEGLKG